jgi:hypothetical protein
VHLLSRVPIYMHPCMHPSIGAFDVPSAGLCWAKLKPKLSAYFPSMCRMYNHNCRKGQVRTRGSIWWGPWGVIVFGNFGCRYPLCSQSLGLTCHSSTGCSIFLKFLCHKRLGRGRGCSLFYFTFSVGHRRRRLKLSVAGLVAGGLIGSQWVLMSCHSVLHENQG